MPPVDPPRPPQARILLIEDDATAARMIKLSLQQRGYRVLEVADGESGVRLAVSEKPDLVILDVVLPGIGGFDVCRELRRVRFNAPILMVTGQHLVEDRVAGLTAGADDYLPKPFDDRELLARVEALLRRQQRTDSHPRFVAFGDVNIDFEHRTAQRAGALLPLTKIEFALLEMLAREDGRPVSRKTILDAVWSYSRTPESRTVDTHIYRLRRKLGDSGTEPRFLKFVSGQGYLLEGKVAHTGSPPPA